MKKLLSGLLALAILVGACSKSSTSANGSASITGKWSSVNSISSITVTGYPTQTDTFPAHAGEYVNFGTNGMAYGYSWNDSSASFYYDTSSYQVNGSTLAVTGLVGGKDTTINFTIKTLTSSNLTLYLKISDAYGTSEQWNNYQR